MDSNWKDISGYEGYYQVDTHGNVRSVPRLVKGKHGNSAKRFGKTLSPSISKTGYWRVLLIKCGLRKNISVHRLVAVAFIENANAHSSVNHIDGNKGNNTVGNLEWCSVGDNNRHARKHGLNVAKSGKESHSYGLKNKQSLVLIHNTTKEKKPICEVAREYGFSTRHITMMVKGERTNKTDYSLAS